VRCNNNREVVIISEADGHGTSGESYCGYTESRMWCRKDGSELSLIGRVPISHTGRDSSVGIATG
jgi:hypothetical protein